MTLEIPEWAHNVVYLDDNNAVTFVTWKDETEPYMAIWYHNRPGTDTLCFGSFGWRNPSPETMTKPDPLWTLHSLNPLTVTPSLLCLDCKAHGFITNGKWVPA